MTWKYLAQFLKDYSLWVCSPANDDWPVVDEISVNLGRKIG